MKYVAHLRQLIQAPAPHRRKAIIRVSGGAETEITESPAGMDGKREWPHAVQRSSTYPSFPREGAGELPPPQRHRNVVIYKHEKGGLPDGAGGGDLMQGTRSDLNSSSTHIMHGKRRTGLGFCGMQGWKCCAQCFY